MPEHDHDNEGSRTQEFADKDFGTKFYDRLRKVRESAAFTETQLYSSSVGLVTGIPALDGGFYDNPGGSQRIIYKPGGEKAEQDWLGLSIQELHPREPGKPVTAFYEVNPEGQVELAIYDKDPETKKWIQVAMESPFTPEDLLGRETDARPIGLL